MLVSGKKILRDAHMKGYAVGAFNVSNLEMVQAVIEAACEERSPAIISVSESAIKYAGIGVIFAIVKINTALHDIPIALHLDHGSGFEIAERCIDFGFTSVMIDASHEKFEKNIMLTKKVAAYAHKRGVSVEGELGTIGGAEDNIKSRNIILTDPLAAKEFVKRTGIDSLAVAVGTSHGAYKFAGETKLAYDRIREIKKCLNMPLVLHGASGLPQWLLNKAKNSGMQVSHMKGVSDNAIKKAVNAGINKVNIDTDSRIAFTAGMREMLKDKKLFDPRKYLGSARELMKKNAVQKMRLFGSRGKAQKL